MKILMLCPLISSSSFITVYPYAKILSKHFDVKIVGPLLGKEPYIKDSKINMEFIEPKIKNPIQLSFLELYARNRNYVKKQEFDIIHCFKLLPHTAPVGVFAKSKMGKRFFLTIDDYDVKGPKNPLKKIILKFSEKSYIYADQITVSSTFLQKVYGGEVIYQVANEELFLKRKPKPEKFRKKYNIENRIIIAYAGTLYDFKGIDILLEAAKRINRKDVQLVIAGEPSNRYINKTNKAIFTGKIDMEEVADMTAAADIYVIPTKENLYSKAEIPAKIFEAMMMGKPIIASRISDIPEILGNGKCGFLVKPGSVKNLEEKLRILLEDRTLRKKLGSRAKKRYLEKYSYKQIEKKILKVYYRII